MPSSIDAVIGSLDAIIAQALQERSPLGYFPALYKRVTIHVKQAIERQAFDDNERMERLDVAFAQRYLDAYHSFRSGAAPTESWRVAFRESENPDRAVLQHLLLGMNAHISLDLGIAAAETAEGDPLALKADFYAINAILGSLIGDTQHRLSRIFGPLILVDRLLGPIDESLSLFSIGYARDRAWTQTLELSLAPATERPKRIAERDAAVARFAGCLASPRSFCIRVLLLLIRPLERGDTETRIRLLNGMAESDSHAPSPRPSPTPPSGALS